MTTDHSGRLPTLSELEDHLFGDLSASQETGAPEFDEYARPDDYADFTETDAEQIADDEPAVPYPATSDDKLGDTETDQLVDGFCDSHQVVRVWADQHGVVTNISIAKSWQSILKGLPLADAVTEAFASFREHFHPGPEVPDDLPCDEFSTSEPLTSQALQETARQVAEVIAEHRANPPEFFGSYYTGAKAIGTDFDDCVAVQLSWLGYPEEASFDRDWLTRVGVTAISQGLMGAYRDACRNFVAPQAVYDQNSLTAAKLAGYSRQVLQMLRNGVRVNPIPD